VRCGQALWVDAMIFSDSFVPAVARASSIAPTNSSRPG